MEKQEVTAGGGAPMCANGCGYFGSAANKNYCSKCFKDLAPATEEKKTATTTKPGTSSKTPVVVAPPPPPVTTVTVADEATASATEEVKQKDEAPAAAILCVAGCGFFGSAERRNMCSMCYIDGASTVDAPRKLLEKIKADKAAVKAPAAATEEPPLPAAEEEAVEAPKAAPNRCATCRKKVGLLGFACRCGGTFCSLHRHAEKHACDFDFKKADREQLAKNNPLVVAPKIDKI